MSVPTLDPTTLVKAIPGALRKLDPRTMWRNPVMFIVEIGAAFSTVLAIVQPSWFAWLIVAWLWLTVLFGNFAEALAEGRGKAQAVGIPAKMAAIGRLDLSARAVGISLLVGVLFIGGFWMDLDLPLQIRFLAEDDVESDQNSAPGDQ